MKTKSDVLIFNTWNECSVTAPIDLEGEGYSVEVLIDLNGQRKSYGVGWYDYDNKCWRFHEYGRAAIFFHFATAKWQYLPLLALEGKSVHPVKL